MRLPALLALLLVAACAQAERILLIPLDSRPAAGQFAQMIARIAGVKVQFPPYDALGKFTTAGDPGRILAWLETQDMADVSAIIVSTDMVAYGGLVASRTNGVSQADALIRLRRLSAIKAKMPRVPIFAFSSTMRLAPTATRETTPYAMRLARVEELRDRIARGALPGDRVNFARIAPTIPDAAMRSYRAARKRDHEVQKKLIAMAADGTFDFLAVGQDDARPYGPHVAETLGLKAETARLNAAKRVAFCEGIDQLASVMVSRALLRRHDWTPRVRLVASDPAALARIARYESKPLAESVLDEIRASGAELAADGQPDDYALYLNVPSPEGVPFDRWLGDLDNELAQGFPVAVADVNFGADGAADPVLFAALSDKGRFARLLAYAGWNTAGNTVGTTVPAANVYLLARRIETDPVARETAQKEFLLHRVANDYAYHKTTRPTAYRILADFDKISHDETDGTALVGITDFVRRDLKKQVERLFREQFLGKPFAAGARRYALSGLDGIQIWLPWPRVYEVRLEFNLQARSVEGE